MQNKVPVIVTLISACALSACGGDNVGSSSSSSTSSSSSSSSSNSSSSSSGISIIPGGNDTGSISAFTDLPKEYRISEDGERLEMGGFFVDDFFNDTEIETIYLDFPQADYRQALESNYSSKTNIEATITYKGQTYDQVGVRYRGMTSYLMSGDKKSFSVDLDWVIEDQDIDGYDTFKLNNAANDPSNIREVLYDNLANDNIPSAKASLTRLIVNGQDHGVYAKVQKLDKDHAKQWFMDSDATRWRAEDPAASESGGFGGGFGGGGFGGGGFGGGGFGNAFGAGTSSLNDLGSDGSAYENAYTLKYAAVDSPYQDLANAAYTMGTASPDSLVEQLSQYMDIDAALWFIATENVFVDDDSYINKGGMDYYVYFDVATGRIVPVEYDGNETMSSSHATSWSPFYNEDNANFPLMNILLSIPELRQRYLAHYRTIVEESLDSSRANSLIDSYVSLIDSAVNQASVRQYSYSEFLNGIADVRNFFDTRRNFVMSNSEVNRTGVTISDVQDAVNGQVSVRPDAAETVEVSARVSGGPGVNSVYLYYGSGLAGSFDKVAMNDNDNDGVFTGTIPAFPRGSYVRYYVEAIANDSAGTATYNPKGAEHDVYIYQVQAADLVASDVVINELMADNESTVTDEDGEFGDWIELYNNSDQPVDLSGYYLTDEESQLERWAFPSGTTIPANGTLIVWADDKVESASGLHANFKLSASGENLYLVTPDLSFADFVTFSDAPADQSYARSPNGSGSFMWNNNVTFDQAN